MQGAGATVVADVQRSQQVDAFGAAHLADDQPIRTHSQRVPNQGPQLDRAGTLDVGRSGLEPHHVRMVRPQFAGVLDDHDALARINATEHRRQHRGLAATGAAGHHE